MVTLCDRPEDWMIRCNVTVNETFIVRCHADQCIASEWAKISVLLNLVCRSQQSCVPYKGTHIHSINFIKGTLPSCCSSLCV